MVASSNTVGRTAYVRGATKLLALESEIVSPVPTMETVTEMGKAGDPAELVATTLRLLTPTDSATGTEITPVVALMAKLAASVPDSE